MDSSSAIRLSDPATVMRYLQLRSHLHDRVLARVEQQVLQRYDVQPTGRIPATLIALVRKGFVRAAEGEVWPAVFLTPVDITLAMCVQITNERLTSLGTVIDGPQRIKHRHWEDWWGWEVALERVHVRFFDVTPAEQEAAMLSWFTDRFEWLAHNGLLRRR